MGPSKNANSFVIVGFHPCSLYPQVTPDTGCCVAMGDVLAASSSSPGWDWGPLLCTHLLPSVSGWAVDRWVDRRECNVGGLSDNPVSVEREM